MARLPSMIKAAILGTVLALGLVQAACAGPWARPSGAAFLSYSMITDVTGETRGDLFHSVYGEAGLGKGLTLGLDLGRDHSTDEATVFLRYTFTGNADLWQFASDGGIARRTAGGRADTTLYRVGVSVGRGLSRADFGWMPGQAPESGWLSLDVVALLDPFGDQSLWYAQATAGADWSDEIGGMLQLTVEELPGRDLTATLTPSLLWSPTETTTVQMGARFGLQGAETLGLQLSVWQNF